MQSGSRLRILKPGLAPRRKACVAFRLRLLLDLCITGAVAIDKQRHVAATEGSGLVRRLLLSSTLCSGRLFGARRSSKFSPASTRSFDGLALLCSGRSSRTASKGAAANASQVLALDQCRRPRGTVRRGLGSRVGLSVASLPGRHGISLLRCVASSDRVEQGAYHHGGEHSGYPDQIDGGSATHVVATAYRPFRAFAYAAL